LSLAVDVQVANAPVMSPREMARQRNWVLGIVNVSHVFNHTVTGMYPVLLAVMMVPLGFDYAALGVLQAVHNTIASALQASYGFITQYFKRAVLMGVGQIIFGLGTSLTGFAVNFPMVVACKALSGVGSSPQHVVGAVMLSTWFDNARGRMLALHSTAGNIGTLVAPLLAAFLLTFLDWRVVFLIIGIPSILVGISYFLLRDTVKAAPIQGRVRLARAGWEAYKACLTNRNLLLVSLLMMVGAAGRQGGINQTYLIPHFMFDLGIAATVAASLLTLVQAGGVIAPLAWGWISDLVPRKLVMQIALLLSAGTTVWLGLQDNLDFLLVLNLAIHGLVVNARGAITQAMVGDYAGEELQDAAFSLYYTIGLISGPFWVILMGAVMQTYGFALATQIAAVSYLVGMLILIPLQINPRRPAAA
jgi:MFS family permease